MDMINNSSSLENVSRDGPDMFYTVVYGLVSVTFVSLLSLGGALIGPLLASDTKHRWLHFFLAMAVSTLSSDAILHIIPQVLGVHFHAHAHFDVNDTDHGHSHDHRHDHAHHQHETQDEITWLTVTPTRRNLLRLSVIVLSIYTLYFIEFFMFYRKTHLHYCESSSSKTARDSKCTTTTTTSPSNSLSEIEQEEEENNNNNEERKRRKWAGHELISLRKSTRNGRGSEEEGGNVCGLKPRALIILFGDGVHNLVDGVAIGASFMVSPRLGLITTIAVICHELPHEIGDLAVLIDSGLTMCTALWLNLLSALTAYVGLFVALVAGRNDEHVESVLLAVTAGMFLYVAWVDMLSHLKHDSLMADHWIVTSMLQMSGFVVGFVLIFSLGWFEHLFE